MTPKQIEQLKKKIADVKRTLASEKRKYGCYDDGRGLRYLPTGYFIKIADWTGGLAYTKWFHKNFPDDSGFPELFFEWAVILFKNNELKEAEKKLFETFCCNTYVLDKFIGKKIVPINKYEYSNIDSPSYTEYFQYKRGITGLQNFEEWLNKIVQTQKFVISCQKFIETSKQINVEKDAEKRIYLVKYLRQIETNY